MQSSNKRLVLVVDDDAVFRSYASRILRRKFNFETLEAGNGSEGLEIIQEHRPDLVILDQRMPILDGFETLRAIRSDSQFANLPVIIATSSNDMDAFKKMAVYEPTDYILKPIDMENFISRMSRVVAKIRKRQQAEQAEPQRNGSDKTGVLVIEKDENFRKFVDQLLSDRFAVHSTHSGPAGLSYYLEHRPRIVIIGQGIVLLNELLLARKIKTGNFHLARVLYLCEQGSQPIDLDKHFDAVLIKTFKPDEFLEHFNDIALQDDIPAEAWLAILAGAQSVLEQRMVPIVGFPVRFSDAGALALADDTEEDIIKARILFEQTGTTRMVQLMLCGINVDILNLRKLVSGAFPSRNDLDEATVLRHMLSVIEKIFQSHIADQDILLNKATGDADLSSMEQLFRFDKAMICNESVVLQLTVRVLEADAKS